MMGSSITPLMRQRSVKFHIDENMAKPSIKITVSSDALAETILKNNASSSSETLVESDEASSNIGGVNAGQQQQPALIQIVGNCCSSSVGGDGVQSAPPNGALCNCANGDEKRTRIALDDFTVLEFPSCIDFGIKDFLCCKDEIELDLSSDTDASYLDATPPHRFSDSELDNQIEAMSITLDTQLNPFSNSGFYIKSNIDTEEDEEEEETTEESFIMDEEEVSSSASTSAATICGTGDGNGMGDLEQEDHISVTSSEILAQGEFQGTLVNVENTQTESAYSTDEANKAQSPVEPINNDKDSNSTPVQKRLLEAYLQKEHNGRDQNESVDDTEEALSVSNKSCHQLQTFDSENFNDVKLEVDELQDACQSDLATMQIATTPSEDKTTGRKMDSNKPKSISRKILQHPTKHFKRQISLPASIFMSYLLEQNNKANYAKQSSSDAKMNVQNEERQNQHNCDIIAKNKLNRSNSCNKSTNPCNRSKIDMYRNAEVIHGSTEDYEYDDINISNPFNETSNNYSGENDSSHASVANKDNSRNTSLCGHDQPGWDWESKSDTYCNEQNDDSNDDVELDEQQAFTSEVEKRSLILRHVRRLIRQDTTGNFAPPDFSI